MITHTNYRRQNGFPEACLSSYEQPLLEALRSLVIYELGYGGHITVLTKTEVVVETPVMNKMDRTVFTGSKEEMKALVAVAQAHVIISEKGRNAIVRKTMEDLFAAIALHQENSDVPFRDIIAQATPVAA